MAVEGNQTNNDGTVVAGADFSNTAGLAGPGGSGQYLAVKLSTAADRTILLQNAANSDVYGILQNKPKAGEAGNVNPNGVSKVVYGGTIAAGSFLTTDSSARLVTATTGQLACAKALVAGVVGDVGTAEILPARILAP